MGQVDTSFRKIAIETQKKKRVLEHAQGKEILEMGAVSVFAAFLGGKDTKKKGGRRILAETERVKVCVLCIHCCRTFPRWCETHTRD